ncbi:hypothetical protein AXG93_150s1020 [Marchantia polymorpha subsp. ruderalis]|uniref:Uncharacterized protein n=1 Tax=Marchantia polymorpha subsp. ruderalis TaxID=1480154 RepID=A0A176WEQ8_MARPO|nr:hypothetical protein AXG93_150s1020 [Marchantia polymorpha subsp. ruderalis]
MRRAASSAKISESISNRATVRTTFARVGSSTWCGRSQCYGFEGKGSTRSPRANIAISSKNEREREKAKSTKLASSETQIEDMASKKSEKVRKLVPLKVSYKELRPFRRELSELRLEFLLWNWNCVSASICKEVLDKSMTKGKELCGNPMLWTIEHWTKVIGPCAGSDGDLLFVKNSVGLTCVEEFSYGPLFESGRQRTNAWKTVDYKDPKRRAIALGIMHILRPGRTTYVTAWQVWFFERILKGRRVHWTRIFHDLVWVNAGSQWTGPLTNHITPFLVNFYRGMGLLTRKEEKRFPREREILSAESSEGNKDDNRPPSIPTHTTARELVQLDVVQKREKPDRRLAKRRKVVSDDEEELAHELGKAEMRSQESQRRMEKAEEAYRQLREESTDELKLRLEKRVTGFAMWGLQTVKWLKLDSLE